VAHDERERTQAPELPLRTPRAARARGWLGGRADPRAGVGMYRGCHRAATLPDWAWGAGRTVPDRARPGRRVLPCTWPYAGRMDSRPHSVGHSFASASIQRAVSGHGRNTRRQWRQTTDRSPIVAGRLRATGGLRGRSGDRDAPGHTGGRRHGGRRGQSAGCRAHLDPRARGANRFSGESCSPGWPTPEARFDDCRCCSGPFPPTATGCGGTTSMRASHR
jgi:hypothetical protein